MVTFGIIFLFIVVSTTNGLNTGDLNEECRTPDDRNGQCVLVIECNSLLLGILSKNEAVIDLTKKSICRYYENPLVCCENEQVVVSSKHNQFLPQTDLCGYSDSYRIIPGVVADLDQYRWAVILEYKKKVTGEKTNNRCTGSLINKRYVLTSASCLSDDEFELTNIRLGDWDTSVDPDCQESIPGDKICADPVKSIKITKEVKHPNYNGGVTDSNIGLIKLEEEAVYTDYTKPVCLPHGKKISDLFENSTMVVSGWGTFENGTQSNQLLHQHGYQISNKDCNEKIPDDKALTESESCIVKGYTSFDPCLVNKGSPVMRLTSYDTKLYQVGIVTWTEGCGADYPIVYTDVLRFIPWILNTISEE